MNQIHTSDPPVYTVLEGMTSISALLQAKQDGINDRPIFKILYDRSKEKKKFREIRFLSLTSKKFQFELTATNSEEIDFYSVGQSHGGIVALCGERTIPSLTANQIQPSGFYVMLEGIEDPYNFGSAIRSLYASGVNGIVLSPRNWMSAAGTVARSSAGTSELLRLFVSDAITSIEYFHENAYNVLCAGIRNSVSIYEKNFSKPLYLIIGGEKRGISSAVLEKADQIVRIDYGRKFQGSLSTAAAASILAFEIMRQNQN